MSETEKIVVVDLNEPSVTLNAKINVFKLPRNNRQKRFQCEIVASFMKQ